MSGVFALPAAAQDTSSADQVHFGVQLSWGDDSDLGLGVRVETPLQSLGPRVRGIGSFDYFFPDGGTDEIDISYLELNVGLAYSFTLENQEKLAPYVGGGLNFARAAVSAFGESVSDTELGLNLLVGSVFGDSRPAPFVELRVELSGGEQFVLTGGFVF